MPSVVMPACGPVRLIAATPIDWSAIESSVALWCSPVASRTSSSRGSGSSVIAAASASSSSVVSPIAETTTTRSLPPVRSRAMRRATRLMRSAPATEDPPNFITTRGLGMGRILAEEAPRPAGGVPGTMGSTACVPGIGHNPVMCYDHDSRPPIPEIAGGALDGADVDLTAADGNRFAAYVARAAEPTGAGIVILPDVRGLHAFFRELALRFAERGVDAIAIDYFGRTTTDNDRGEEFDYGPHVAQTRYAGLRADIEAAAAHLRSAAG